MSNYLVTFAGGHSTLFTSRSAAELAASHWPHEQPTIRDLDQEAKDREDMLQLLVCAEDAYECISCEWGGHDCHESSCEVTALLKRLGRLP